MNFARILDFIINHVLTTQVLARFALLLFMIAIIPRFCRRIHVPEVVGLLLAGVIVGPHVLVPRVVHIAGYNLFSLTRASAVVKCQSPLACFLLRLFSHAATSSVRVCLSEMRRSRHWLDKTLSSDSAMSSQLPCLGV